MKILASFLFLLLIVVSNSGQTPPPPQTQLQAVFDSFHNSIDELTKRFGKDSVDGIETEIADSVHNIDENLKFLEAVLNLGKPIPKEYLEGVSLDSELLKELATQKSKTLTEQKSLLAGLKEVESDLEVKVTGPRAGGEIPRVVEVFVHARKGSENLGAYQVWYVPKGLAKVSSRFKPFDRLTDPSNPSSMKLAPGNYFIWLSKGKPVTEPQPVTLGENGESQRVIDVPIP